MNKGIFITGTDTGIGKTVISCGLLQSLNKQGLHTAAMKPIASGAKNNNGQLQNEDALALQQSASEQAPYELINPYVFEPAIAPHLAAEQADVEIQFDHIKQVYQKLSKSADVTIVEGVGGWLVPLNKNQSVADLALHLELPVILVVGMRLGCLNHALLTAESIQQKGASLIGWVANVIEPEFSMLDENIETLRKQINAPLLGVNPYQGDGRIDLDVSLF